MSDNGIYSVRRPVIGDVVPLTCTPEQLAAKWIPDGYEVVLEDDGEELPPEEEGG